MMIYSDLDSEESEILNFVCDYLLAQDSSYSVTSLEDFFEKLNQERGINKDKAEDILRSIDNKSPFFEVSGMGGIGTIRATAELILAYYGNFRNSDDITKIKDYFSNTSEGSTEEIAESLNLPHLLVLSVYDSE